ncbi:MAG: hypothetical protein AABX73_04565 [Nanoarchaeota archaeon]
MKDIFDATILCKECNIKMKPSVVEKSGFSLRVVECPECGDKIIHPSDLSHFNQYNDLKRKTYNVKLRVVGNSHAISIPKEIVDFINEMHGNMRKDMNDVVRLCFEDSGRLSVNFFDSRGGKKW